MLGYRSKRPDGASVCVIIEGCKRGSNIPVIECITSQGRQGRSPQWSACPCSTASSSTRGFDCGVTILIRNRARAGRPGEGRGQRDPSGSIGWSRLVKVACTGRVSPIGTAVGFSCTARITRTDLPIISLAEGQSRWCHGSIGTSGYPGGTRSNTFLDTILIGGRVSGSSPGKQPGSG